MSVIGATLVTTFSLSAAVAEPKGNIKIASSSGQQMASAFMAILPSDAYTFLRTSYQGRAPIPRRARRWRPHDLVKGTDRRRTHAHPSVRLCLRLVGFDLGRLGLALRQCINIGRRRPIVADIRVYGRNPSEVMPRRGMIDLTS